MGKPRVFISSTYYDLRAIRADLERFVREVGYDPVLNERGHIAYHTEKRLEDACYKEIEMCDILVSIIGGRYGTESHSSHYSISQREFKTALEFGRPIYVFIEKAVLSEYRTYEKNKSLEGIQYASVDDRRIYSFIEEINSLPLPQPIAPFELARDITDYLQEQWAGLFQRLLKDEGRRREANFLHDIKSTVGTLNKLVTYLSDERNKGDETIKDILLTSHPFFEVLRKKLAIPYRFIISNYSELQPLLIARKAEENSYEEDEYYTWTWRWAGEPKLLMISKELFDDDGKLRILTAADWKEDYVQLQDIEPGPLDGTDTEDDLPF